jgi:predicted GTPase
LKTHIACPWSSPDAHKGEEEEGEMKAHLEEEKASIQMASTRSIMKGRVTAGEVVAVDGASAAKEIFHPDKVVALGGCRKALEEVHLWEALGGDPFAAAMAELVSMAAIHGASSCSLQSCCSGSARLGETRT